MTSYQNVRFRPLFVVIKPGLVIVHHMDPRPLDQSKAPFALVVIDPDKTGSMINNITGVYRYGTEDEEYIESQIDDLDLNSLFPGLGSTVMERLKHCFLSLSGEARRAILCPTEPELNGFFSPSPHLTTSNNQYNTTTITNGVTTGNSYSTDSSALADIVVYPRSSSTNTVIQTANTNVKALKHASTLSFPGSTDFERFMAAFLVGVASHLAIFDVIKHNQSTIGNPFHPLKIGFPPVNDEPEELLTQGIGEYLGYHARTLQAIARGEKLITRVGPTWLTLIDHFWMGFTPCFRDGSLKDPTSAIHDTMVGYCKHQDKKVRQLETRFTQISTQAGQSLTNIQSAGKTILDQIEATTKRTKEELDQICQGKLDQLATAYKDFEGRVTQLSAESVKIIREERTSTISSITALRSDAQKSMGQAADEGVEQIQAVYSQGYEEMASTKTENLRSIEAERQHVLKQIASREDDLFDKIKAAQRQIIVDLAELHNTGIEKNFQMIDDRKQHFVRFGEQLSSNLNQIVQNHVGSIKSMKQEVIRANQLATTEIETKVKVACQELKSSVTTGLTDMLDQQSHIVNGIRKDAKKFSQDELRQSMNWAVEETLRRLRPGVDRIVANSLRQQISIQVANLNHQILSGKETTNQTRSIPNKQDLQHQRGLEARVDMLDQQLSQALVLIGKMSNYLENQSHYSDCPTSTCDPSLLNGKRHCDGQVTPAVFSPLLVKLAPMVPTGKRHLRLVQPPCHRRSSPFMKIISTETEIVSRSPKEIKPPTSPFLREIPTDPSQTEDYSFPIEDTTSVDQSNLILLVEDEMAQSPPSSPPFMTLVPSESKPEPFMTVVDDEYSY